MSISILIPTLNESHYIGRLIERLLTANKDNIEIIVIDGGSKDDTVAIVKSYGIPVVNCTCSRAIQMNAGAKIAKHSILYFVHADTLPPIGYYEDGNTFLEKEYDAACYKSKYESKKVLLRLNEFFTQFNWLVSRGGDQSLFIKKETFIRFGMFKEDMVIMEEYPLIKKLMQSNKLAIIPKNIQIGCRKYNKRSWLKVSRANYSAFRLLKKGVDSQQIKTRYIDLLD